MSGGQMQRVAIARALVNNPDILLADEPTGALDTTTSVQIMELLKEVARDRLVIMVTHNPELAEEYSTRIVRLRDGLVIDDSNPFEGEPEPEVAEIPVTKAEKKQAKKTAKKKAKKNSMTFLTALSLSKNNLLTKKGRTILTSFAGSIGIIGIALILSISNGIQGYIDQVQEDTLSTYPLTVNRTETDISSMMSAMTETSQMQIENPDPNTIYVDDSMGTMMAAMSATVENDLVSFKRHIDKNYAKISNYVSDIQYTYDFDLQIYTADGKTQVNPTKIFDSMGDAFAGMGDLMSMSGGALNIFSEMINNQELLEQQYELVGEDSHWPTNKNEVVLVVGRNNQLSALSLYMLGVLPQEELADIMTKLMQDGEYESKHNLEYSLDDFLGMEFWMLSSADFYAKTANTYRTSPDSPKYHIWQDMREYGFPTSQEEFVTSNGTKLVISGIVRPKEGVSATSITGTIGYRKDLTDLILEKNTNCEIINQQKETPTHNVLDGAKFERVKYTKQNLQLLIDRVGSTNMNKFYSMATSMIFTNPEFSSQLDVTQQSLSFFLAMMDDAKQKTFLERMLADAIATSTEGGVNDALSMLPVIPGTTLNTTNLIPLLPSIPEIPNEQGVTAKMMVFGALQRACNPTTVDSLCQEIEADLPNWKLNDKSFTLLTNMGFLDENFDTVEQMLYDLVPTKDATYESNLRLLGDAEMADPASINFYAKDFESKEAIEAFIKEYNDSVDEDQKIEYTDLVGILMSSISVIIDVISYVLIAFVSISLIVSSIMIGIITYISVLERTKEIGILRSIGASKKDISRVFNAETLIVGFVAGLIGILSTVLLCLPINAIIYALSGVEGVRASLPVVAAIVLVAISMLLTFIAGLIPSRLASKKDPVEALRSE